LNAHYGDLYPLFINPLNTSSWKSILDPFRVQMA